MQRKPTETCCPHSRLTPLVNGGQRNFLAFQKASTKTSGRTDRQTPSPLRNTVFVGERGNEHFPFTSEAVAWCYPIAHLLNMILEFLGGRERERKKWGGREEKSLHRPCECWYRISQILQPTTIAVLSSTGKTTLCIQLDLHWKQYGSQWCH